MLWQRITTAVIIVPLILAALFRLPTAAILGLIGLVILAGGREWGRFFGWETHGPRLVYGASAVAVAVAVWFAIRYWNVEVWLFGASMLWWAVALVWIARFPTPISKAMVAVCGYVVLVPTFAALAYLVTRPDGAQWLLFLLLTVWAADVGAFFAGRTVGRRKLAPNVSPGKTWEGVIGGLGASLLVALAGARWFGGPTPVFLFLGALTASISVVGDLTVSMFKRHAGLKDSGRLLPGHGGVLDRIDSITAAAPAFALVIQLSRLS